MRMTPKKWLLLGALAASTAVSLAMGRGALSEAEGTGLLTAIATATVIVSGQHVAASRAKKTPPPIDP